jgi:hypothetical protein
MNDTAINKIESIQRCVRRAREEFEADPKTSTRISPSKMLPS